MQKSLEQQPAIAVTATGIQEPLATASFAIERQMAKDALLADPTIEDCVVLNRAKATSEPQFVAYVVPVGKFSAEQIQSRLQAVLPSKLLPLAYVPVAKLPLTATGQVHEQALTAIEVIDADLVERWEADLQSLPEIQQVAVIVQDSAESSPPLHLSDLLPNWKSQSAIATVAPIETVDRVPAIDETSEPKALAISHGGSFPEEPNVPSTLPEVLQRAARQVQGDCIVYLQGDGFEVTQSYQALLTEAERILAGLRQQGLKPQDKVIFQLELNQDIIPAFWGCLLGGFIPVIMGVAPTYSKSNNAVDKLCNVWQLLDEPLIVTTEALQTSVRSLNQWLPSENFKVSAIEALRKHEPDKDYHPSQPNDPAFFNLTSGSTGMPKCISLTHKNLISRARGTNILSQHSQADVILNWLPFDHIGSISDWHVRCVYLGCRLIYATKEYILGRPLNWLDLIDKYRITHSWAPNFAYALIYDALQQDPEHKWDLSCVKSLLTAGEAVSSTAVKDFIATLAIHGFKPTAIRPAFGMAEMGSGVTYYQPTAANPLGFHTVDKSSLSGAIKRVSIDRPNCTTFTDLGPVIPGVSIRIVDKDNSLVSEDTIGYLQVKGEAVFHGYYKNPTVNQEVFVEDGWFNTGDLGFITNGHLVVTGRAKETIIINGANYYNHEIEAVVEELDLVDVSYTAACAVRDAKGTTDKLAIFFSASSADEEHLVELLKQIRQTVVSNVGVNPDYLIPVRKEDIPKTAIGKIQRSQLSKCFEAGEFEPILKRIDILLKNTNTLPDWFYHKSWQPKEAVSIATQPRQGQTLVFLDSLGLGESLCAENNRQGQSWIIVEIGSNFAKLRSDRYQIVPHNPDHYRQLLKSIAAEQIQISQLLHLWNYDNYVGEIASPQALERSLERSVYSLVFLVQALAEVQFEQQVRLLVAASHTQPTSTSDRVAPEKAPILGVIKAVSQELPWLDCRHVDLSIDSAQDNAALLLNELYVEQRSPEVAYRQGQRLVPCLEKVNWQQEAHQELPFKQGGMYLLSGGLGGIGVEIAKYLLQNYSAKLLLVGRTPLPERNQWDAALKTENSAAQRIQAYLSLEQLGGEIAYEAVDLGDRFQVQQVVEAVKSRWQCELDGVIHLAGTAPECLIVEETRESLAATLQPKVLGTWVLHQLIKDQPHSIFISFSSLASFFSGATIGAYAAANSFLECFTHYQRYQRSMHSYCFAWAMWDAIGMSRNSQAKDLLRAKGYQATTLKQGMDSLLVGLHHDQGQLLVGLDGSNRNIRQYIEPQVNRRLQTLAAYFTATTESISPTQLAALNICDRFGTPSQCSFKQLQEMPLATNGEIDRDRLLALARPGATEQVKPRTELEYQMASIWQEVLSIPQVGIQDSFFELGGSSLQAARLFAEIEKTFGKNLPLATLFEAPTIEQLVSLLGESGSVMWSSVAPIQPNGSKPPLFCIHGAGGNILMYRQLIPYLGLDQPLYGIQPKGLDGKETPLSRIPEMAEIYVKEMREFQPEGPYYLTGLSAGGLIAYEMARVLHAQGQEVALLALIDPHAPGYPKLLPVVPRLLSLLPHVALLLAGRIPQRTSKFIQSKFKRSHSAPVLADPVTEQGEALPLEEITQADSRNLPTINSVHDRLEYFSLWLLKYTPWAFLVPRFYLDEGRSLPSHLQRVQEANVKATLTYEAQVYSGQVVLFRASAQPPGCYCDPQLGWGDLVTGGLEIYEVPGYHSESLLYNNKSVGVLGKQLKACLDEAQARCLRSEL